MNLLKSTSGEERKRMLEVVAVFFAAALLLALSTLETRLFTWGEHLSENREFFTTLAYFALININVILILFLSFLIFRNVTRLIVERRRGILGSKLRTKLVFSLVFFALAPTILLFYVSMKFVTTSFETWFSEKVKETMQQTSEAGSLIYKQDQKRLQSLARIALQRVTIDQDLELLWDDAPYIDPSSLEGFDKEYGLNAVKVYDITGTQIWNSKRGFGSEVPEKHDSYVLESIRLFLMAPELGDHSTVVGEENQDVVKGAAPLRDPYNNQLLGLVLTEVRFETRILKSIEKIISDFGNLKPGAQLIRLSYMILMIVITLLIVFSAIWMGFYVARAITGPLQSLAGATREVALGNYDVTLKAKTDDETGQLVHAFNHMTKDLREHQKNTLEAQFFLQKSNEELEQRRQYMEIVLKHITAGVISLDPEKRVTSVNAAAERLLRINGKQLNGVSLKEGFSNSLYEVFWAPILEGLNNRTSFRLQNDLYKHGYDVNLIINASRIYDEDVEMGIVVVFDDAQEQVRAQRVAAWREVARRIAHEIKNPITPIKLSAQRLLRKFHNKFEADDYETFGDCIETIITQVDSLRDLVNEFSKFSRMPRIQPRSAKVNPILEDVAKFFSVSYPEISIDYSDIQETPSILIDKEQLNRAFVNIFTNALASFEDGRKGQINLSCYYLKDLQTVRVEIADNGCGIPKELHDRVLEPYFSTKDEGTGLGLAIVNQIISDHGGYLRIVANKPFGTMIIIELPVRKSEENNRV
ncbi:MAG: HAMP domain-containing protein [Oligoflexales bacterium]|nr:HAMP domain-containing protein [Oligoflexales bacterium]